MIQKFDPAFLTLLEASTTADALQTLIERGAKHIQLEYADTPTITQDEKGVVFYSSPGIGQQAYENEWGRGHFQVSRKPYICDRCDTQIPAKSRYMKRTDHTENTTWALCIECAVDNLFAPTTYDYNMNKEEVPMETSLEKINGSQAMQVIENKASMEQFTTILGDRAPHFVTSIKVLINANTALLECTPQSLLYAAMQGASLDLSFDPSLGECYMVPFNRKGDGGGWIKEATFIPGYKGLIQMALRTGEYTCLNAMKVTDRMLNALKEVLEKSDDPTNATITFFEKIDFYPDLHIGKVNGYVAYFRLMNGFAKSIYWDKKKVLEHGEKFSKKFKYGPWQESQDAMCIKTLFRELIGRFGPKSKEMRSVIEQEAHLVIEKHQTDEERLIERAHNGEDADLWQPEPTKKLSGGPLDKGTVEKLRFLLQKLALYQPKPYEEKLRAFEAVMAEEYPQITEQDLQKKIKLYQQSLDLFLQEQAEEDLLLSGQDPIDLARGEVVDIA